MVKLPKNFNTQALALIPTDKVAAIQHMVTSLQNKYGLDVISWLGDIQEASLQSTGLEELDAILHGGLPKGRIVEVFGLRQSGKTAIACQLASQCKVVAFIDAERKMTPSFARAMHLPDATLIIKPEGIEHALEVTRDCINSGFEMVIIDSLPALPSMKETDEKDFQKITGISPTAGLMSRKIPVLLGMLSEHGAILVVVNQQRATINAPAFGEQYHSFGGLALANYASVRIATARRGWLKHDKLGVFGATLAVMVDKSNVGIPRRGVELPLVYGPGLVANVDLKDVRSELIKSGGAQLPLAPLLVSSDTPTEYTIEEVKEGMADLTEG